MHTTSVGLSHFTTKKKKKEEKECLDRCIKKTKTKTKKTTTKKEIMNDRTGLSHATLKVLTGHLTNFSSISNLYSDRKHQKSLKRKLELLLPHELLENLAA